MKPTFAQRAAAALLAVLALTAHTVALSDDKPAGKVDGAFIRANALTTTEWPSYGLDYAETRFSRLDRINTSNVKDLGLVWSYDLESTRAVEATPLVVDGIMYVTASWSVLHAVNVRTGKRLWTYDPLVPRDKAYKGCCDGPTAAWRCGREKCSWALTMGA